MATGWKISDKPTVDPTDSDLALIEQGGNTRNTTWAKLKAFFLGTETLKTLAQTIKGAINENTVSLSDIMKLTTCSLSATQSIAGSTDTTILFNSKSSENNLDLATVSNGNITILQSGIYIIESSLTTSSTNITGYLQTKLLKNTSTVLDMYRVPAISAATNSHIKSVYIGHLNANDILNLNLFHTHTASFNVTTDTTYNHIKIKKVG